MMHYFLFEGLNLLFSTFKQLITCTHAMNGGKQRELLLRKEFMLHRSSSLILKLSSRLRCCSISWRMPENRELNSCLAKMGSLFGEGGQNVNDQNWRFSVILFLGFSGYLCECLKWSDEATVRDLDVWEVTDSVATIQSHLSLFPKPLISFFFLREKFKRILTQKLTINTKQKGLFCWFYLQLEPQLVGYLFLLLLLYLFLCKTQADFLLILEESASQS